MLSNILNNSKLVIGIVSVKYNSSLSSYIRFLARSHGFKSKTVHRIEKIEQFSSKYQFLVKGPTMLFYSFLNDDLSLIDKWKTFSDIQIIYISLYGYIFLSDNLNYLNLVNKNKVNLSLPIHNLLCNINITSSYINLVYILDAYSKSIIKRN